MVERRRVLAWVRIVLGVAVAVGVVLALADQWPRVRPHLARFDVPLVVSAFLAVLVALGASMLSWRAVLTELGSRLPLRDAARIYFVGQVGKYLPGSVWPALVQMELGRSAGVPRSRMGVSFVLALALSLLTGAVIGLPSVLSTGRYLLPALGIIVLVLPVLLVPRLLGAVLDRGLRLLRRPPLERPLTRRGILKVVGLSAIGWVAYGVQAWLLAVDLGAPLAQTLPVAVGAYAIALVLGVVVVLAPAGVGVREFMLVVGLASVLTGNAATALAIVSRALVTVADVATAAMGLLLRRPAADKVRGR
ncbi:MAG: UPF0104 family protein [Streptosporangiales bacterium]|nr:UPF0104 family protein [Streptosporangiales bacterium]